MYEPLQIIFKGGGGLVLNVSVLMVVVGGPSVRVLWSAETIPESEYVSNVNHFPVSGPV